jgi:Protein of unknown function (DUF2815)
MPHAVISPTFRLSFPSLFEATADMNGRVNFRMEMLFAVADIKANPTMFAEMKALYNGTVDPKWLTNKEAYRTFEKAFIKGDDKKQPERQGHLILRASANQKFPPRMLRANRTPATDADIYAGCYCRALLTAYKYEAKNEKGIVINRGVAFNIKTVQKVRDGDSFGRGHISAATEDEMLASAPLVEEDEYAELLG